VIFCTLIEVGMMSEVRKNENPDRPMAKGESTTMRTRKTMPISVMAHKSEVGMVSEDRWAEINGPYDAAPRQASSRLALVMAENCASAASITLDDSAE